MKASWGISTLPMLFMRFLPSFCFSNSLRLRLMSHRSLSVPIQIASYQ